MDPWEILSTGAPFDIDAILATSGIPVIGGGDILVGADDDEVAAMLGLSTSGGGDILTGADDEMMALLTGAPLAIGAPARSAKLKKAINVKLAQAWKAGAQRGAAAAQQAKQQQKFGQQAVVTPDSDSKYSKQPIGFDSETDILPGASRYITKKPQKRSKPFRLVLQDPEFWRVKNVLVGNKPQFVSAGAIPGIAFSHDTVGVELIGDTCQIGQDLIIEVENRTGANHRFEAVLICHCVD